jgi:hypothetical protein
MNDEEDSVCPAHTPSRQPQREIERRVRSQQPPDATSIIEPPKRRRQPTIRPSFYRVDRAVSSLCCDAQGLDAHRRPPARRCAAGARPVTPRCRPEPGERARRIGPSAPARGGPRCMIQLVKFRDDPIFSRSSVATDGCDAALSPISQEQFARRRGISLSRPALPTPMPPARPSLISAVCSGSPLPNNMADRKQKGPCPPGPSADCRRPDRAEPGTRR